jgi:cell division protease FtsH
VTQQLPIDDRHNYTREYLEAMLSVMMGGRVSEKLFMNVLTTGAGDDLNKATEMVRKMVCEWGMSDVLGPLTFGKREEQIFLGREIAQHKDYSEGTAILIDQELKRFANEAYARAEAIVRDNRDALARIAEALLEFEVIDGEEVIDLVKGGNVAALRARKRAVPATTPTIEAAVVRPAGETTRPERPGSPISVAPIKQPS